MDTMSVVVVGAGVSGLATAVGLHKVGIPVKIFEKACDLREGGASLNTATNGWRSLDTLGVGDVLRGKSCRLERYVTMRDTGQVIQTVAVSDCHNGPHEVRGIVRNDMIKVLADALPEGTIQFGCGVTSVDLSTDRCTIRLKSGETVACKVLVGADGIYSKVKMAIDGPLPQYSGWAAYRGMAAYKDGIPRFAQDFSLIYGGPEGGVAGLYPLDEQRCYYFFGFPASEREADELRHASKEEMKADLAQRVRCYPCGLDDVVAKTVEEDIAIHHIADRAISPGETWGRGLVTIIGDAAHPTTPAIGQGACMALEDGVELAAELRDAVLSANVSWDKLPARKIEEALRAFESRRSTRCAPLVGLAAQIGKLATTRRWWLGILLRDLFLKHIATKPSMQLKHTLWTPPSLEVPAVPGVGP